MEKKGVLLTISLLVSNSIDTIRKCMESIRPILEQISSELIVVDTVGEENSDGSLAVAKEYATRIVRFEWCNDFSAARNAGLFLASGEWFLTLDDDEWFEDAAPIVQFFLSGEYLQYDCAGYAIRNYTDFSGTAYEENYRFGLVKLFPESRYVEKIHEHLVPLGKKKRQLPVYAHHYGYVYKSEEEKLAHARRNITLIKKVLEEKPLDLRMQAQLVQEYKALDDLCAEKALCEHIVETYQGDVSADLFQYILINLIRVTRDTNKEEGKQKLTWVLEHYPLNPINLMFCILEAIEHAIQESDWEQVVSLAKQYVVSYKQIPKQKFTFPEYNEIASEEKQQIVVVEAIKAMLQMNRYEEAELFFEAVDWENSKQKPFEQMELLLKVYGATNHGRLLFVHANRIIKSKSLIPIFQTMINTFVSEHPEKLGNMQKHLAGNLE